MAFKSILTIEAQVRWVNKYSPREIKVLLRTHPDDFTSEIESSFFDLKESWKTFRLVLMEEVDDWWQPIEQTVERDPMAVKRQQLALNIKSYATHHKKSEEEVLRQLYDYYKVTSRTQLTLEQLNDANWRYRTE